jgi:tetratricopeptide (TPR) repeat protein
VSTPPHLDADSLNAQASAIMKEGLQYLGAPDADAPARALACFDRALDIRRQLPLDGRPHFIYALAACLLNRADALTRLGQAATLDQALESYDEAIALCRTLPLGEDPNYPRRLAIALQNRGLLLRALGRDDQAALRAFADAAELLDSPVSEPISDRPFLAAATLTNMALTRAALLDPASLFEARRAAEQALARVEALEQADPACAEVALKARHVVCQAVAHELSTPSDDAQRTTDAVHAATDMADDGLRLIRLWEQRGVAAFRELSDDLFGFGARVYAAYQPHFLEEFVRDNLDASQSSEGYVQWVQTRSAAILADAARFLQLRAGAAR